MNGLRDWKVILSETGDLRLGGYQTEIGCPGFAYLIVVVDRLGVKMVNGYAIGKERRGWVDPAWLTTTVLRLAAAAEDERHLVEGNLDSTRLAVLADALEEAGCTCGKILGHLRGPGPHTPGCWAVDLILGKD
jgi:hypothetical protein